jgi:hypothetical protein
LAAGVASRPSGSPGRVVLRSTTAPHADGRLEQLEAPLLLNASHLGSMELTSEGHRINCTTIRLVGDAVAVRSLALLHGTLHLEGAHATLSDLNLSQAPGTALRLVGTNMTVGHLRVEDAGGACVDAQLQGSRLGVQATWDLVRCGGDGLYLHGPGNNTLLAFGGSLAVAFTGGVGLRVEEPGLLLGDGPSLVSVRASVGPGALLSTRDTRLHAVVLINGTGAAGLRLLGDRNRFRGQLSVLRFGEEGVVLRGAENELALERLQVQAQGQQRPATGPAAGPWACFLLEGQRNQLQLGDASDSATLDGCTGHGLHLLGDSSLVEGHLAIHGMGETGLTLEGSNHTLGLHRNLSLLVDRPKGIGMRFLGDQHQVQAGPVLMHGSVTIVADGGTGVAFEGRRVQMGAMLYQPTLDLTIGGTGVDAIQVNQAAFLNELVGNVAIQDRKSVV